jgi:hypothetical protein
MELNIGTADRIVRAIVGLAILSLAFIGDESVRWAGVFGFLPLVTAIVGWCPLYSMLGVRTSPQPVRLWKGIRTRKPSNGH